MSPKPNSCGVFARASLLTAVPALLVSSFVPAHSANVVNPHEVKFENLSTAERLKAEYEHLKSAGFSEEDLQVSQLVVYKDSESVSNDSVESAVADVVESESSSEVEGVSKDSVAGDKSVVTVSLESDISSDEQAEVIGKIVDDVVSDPESGISHVEPDYYIKSNVLEDTSISAPSSLASAVFDESEVVEASSVVSTASTPTKGSQAGKLWYLPYINAESAWTQGFTGKGQQIGFVDTGVDPHHPALRGKLTQGYDFVSWLSIADDGNGRDSDTTDYGTGSSLNAYHGTHVNGTASSSALTAIAFNALSQHGKALGKRGNGTGTDVADSGRWLGGGHVAGVPNNTKPSTVVNMSLSFPSATCPSYMKSTIDFLHSRNIPTVVAAGNQSVDAWAVAPANCLGAVVVGASDTANNRASFSNYGSALDIMAPGVSIWSTMNTGVHSLGVSSYGYKGGTSMATPMVAGTLALMKEANPNMTVEQSREWLRSSATIRVGGVPLVNTGRAVALAKSKARTYTPPVLRTGSQFNGIYNASVHGAPVTGVIPTSGGGVYQVFQNGWHLYQQGSVKGAMRSGTGIGSYFWGNGAEGGFLGYPKGNEYRVAHGGVAQDFVKNGVTHTVIWSEGGYTTAIPHNTGIGSHFMRNGSFSAFGFPTGREYRISDGVYAQNFKKPDGARVALVWSEYGGTKVVNLNGGIYAQWSAKGFAGAPVTDEYHVQGSIAQKFRSADNRVRVSYYWNSRTHTTHSLYSGGDIDYKWQGAGGANGSWGDLVVSETPANNGNVYAHFLKNGKTTLAYWSPSHGTVTMDNNGAIADRWRSLGGDKGHLGYPVTSESKNMYGQTFVKFSSGRSILILNGTAIVR